MFKYLIIVFLTTSIIFAQNNTKLSLEEKMYLQNKKEIKMCVDPNWMPFEKIENGKHIGLASDYIKLISKYIHTPIKLVETSSWAQSIEKTKARKCDIYSLVSKTFKREKYMDFTIPYLETPIVIATKKGNKYISDIKLVQSEKLGIVKGYSIIELYKKKYPNINIVEVDSIDDGLLKVERGEIFGYLDNSIVITEAIRKDFIGILKISGKFDTKLKFGVATRNDEKELLSVFNKAINNIDRKTKLKFLNDWVGIDNNIRKEIIKLTIEEKMYLKNNKFTYAGDPNWLPFEAFDNLGNYIGIVAEHINIIEQKLDFKLKKIITKDWTSTLELSKNIEVDIISGDAADVVLAKNYKPIAAYIKNPLVVVTKDAHPFVADLNHLKDKKIAYIDGYGYTADIVKKYPNIKFLKTNSINTALLGVKSGKYDIFIGTLSMIDYTIIQMGIEGIKIAGDTGIVMNLTLFINKNKPQLHTIINKVMSNIDEKSKNNILAKWRHSSATKVIVDYTLIWQILFVSIVIILIILIISFKQRKLKKIIENEKIKFENIFNKSTDGILILTNGIFTDCNDSIIKLLGYKTKEDILSLAPAQISPTLQPDGLNSLEKSKVMMQVAIDKYYNNFEWVHLKADGTEFWADIMLTNISTNEEEQIIHVVWRDITDKKILEADLKEINKNLEKRVKEEVVKNGQQELLMLQQGRLAQMGEMINMIAHQWRQPLNTLSILTQSVILKYNRNKLDDKFVEAFKVNSKKQIEGMSTTIDDFRDFFKPEKEKVEFIMNDVIVDVLDMVKPILLQNNIKLNLDLQDDIKANGFPNELGQCILNIVNNAMDALEDTENKEIKITLKQDENIILNISDNASGIPEEIIDKLFDPYFSTKEEKNGTGLGLYISKIIIEEHMNGKLSVSNDEFINYDGKKSYGAIFTIKL